MHPGNKYSAKTRWTPTAERKPSQLTPCPSETTDDSIPPTEPARPTQDLMSQGQVGGSESDSLLDAILTRSAKAKRQFLPSIYSVGRCYFYSKVLRYCATTCKNNQSCCILTFYTEHRSSYFSVTFFITSLESTSVFLLVKDIKIK